jgi:hypothetical protein
MTMTNRIPSAHVRSQVREGIIACLCANLVQDAQARMTAITGLTVLLGPELAAFLQVYTQIPHDLAAAALEWLAPDGVNQG